MDAVRRRLGFLILPALVFVFYGFALGRYFTSEDFLLVRFLGEHPPWRDPDLWTEPWLGITVIKFYRPISTLLYGLEIAAFGGLSFGYNVVHTLVHALNALLLLAIVRRLTRTMGSPGSAGLPSEARSMPAAIAVLFALYPLHPNTVLFGASFATLFGSTFVLAGFLAYQWFRETGDRRPWGAGLGLFVLALASYETAAIVPLLLVAHDCLLGRHLAGQGRARVLASLPFFGVLGLYFLLRRAIFGVFVGGYEEYSARLVQPRWEVWLPDLITSIQKLHAPVFDHGPDLPGALLVAGLVTVAPLVVFALVWRRTGSGPVRLWLFAWTWILISQAPFAFRPSVPGNGRYWYLTAAGVAMAAGFLARAIAAVFPGHWRVFPAVALVGVGVYWGWLLAGYLDVYLAAGRTTRAIQGALVREHAAAGAPHRTFVTRYPHFLSSAAQAPVAQVFHYGLRDSVNAPFVRAAVPVYPLPPLRDSELVAIFTADPHAVVFEWDGAASRLRRVVPPSPLERPPVEITVLGPRDGAALGPRDLSVELLPGDLRRFRLIVLAQGNATVARPEPSPGHGGAVSIALPAEFVTSMARLYAGGEFLWWIEAYDGGGHLTGFSRMRSFRPVFQGRKVTPA